MIKEYADQILKTKIRASLDEAIELNEQDGVPVLAALKAIARSHGIELKNPRPKKKMERMAKERRTREESNGGHERNDGGNEGTPCIDQSTQRNLIPIRRGNSSPAAGG